MIRRFLVIAVVLVACGPAHAQRPTDPNKALVLKATGEVNAKDAAGALAPVAQGAELARGQELHTGIESEASLAFSDGTVMVVREMSQVQLSDLLSAGQRQTVRVSLKIGEVAAQINPQKTFQSDFKVSTPGATASVRGTKIASLSYTPARGTQVRLTEGNLLVTNNTGGSTAMTQGDVTSVDTDGEVVTPRESTQEESRIHVEPPGLTSNEVDAISVQNQPVGFTPGQTEEAATGEAGATFILRFQKQ